jgi:hypothetical protein
MIVAIATLGCDGESPGLRTDLSDISFTHTAGQDPCPQPLGSFFVEGDAPAGSTVSVEVDLLVIDINGASGPVELPLTESEPDLTAAAFILAFNCSRAANTLSTITLRNSALDFTARAEVTARIENVGIAKSTPYPEDLGGDPALDIIGVDTGVTLLGEPWVQVRTAGGWPPNDSHYSWFCGVELFDADDNSLGEVITQRHDGVAEDIVTGVSANVEVVHLSDGPVFFVRDETLTPDNLFVETGLLESPGSAFLSDGVAVDTVGHEISDPQRP